MWFVRIWPGHRWDLIFVELKGKRDELSMWDQLRDQYWDDLKPEDPHPIDLFPWTSSEASGLLNRLAEQSKDYFRKLYVENTDSAFRLLYEELQDDEWKIERITSNIEAEWSKYENMITPRMTFEQAQALRREIIHRVAWKLFPLKCTVCDGLVKQ